MGDTPNLVTEDSSEEFIIALCVKIEWLAAALNSPHVIMSFDAQTRLRQTLRVAKLARLHVRQKKANRNDEAARKGTRGRSQYQKTRDHRNT